MTDAGFDGALTHVDTVTDLLEKWRHGNKDAFNRLYEIVYADLRKIAHLKLRKWQRNHLLQTTGVVHELYLKWYGSGIKCEVDRKALKKLASHAMSQILLEQVKKAAKRGEQLAEEAAEVEGWVDAKRPGPEFLARRNHVIDKLARTHPEKAVLVRLRLEAGFTLREIAEAFDMSLSHVKREWLFCKEYLTRELLDGAVGKGNEPAPPGRSKPARERRQLH